MGEGKRPNAAPLPKKILVAQGTQAAAKMLPPWTLDERLAEAARNQAIMPFFLMKLSPPRRAQHPLDRGTLAQSIDFRADLIGFWRR
jgi:hypothetical protein